MTEVENLVLEHLKRFQAQQARTDERIESMAADLMGLRQMMAGFMTMELNQDSNIAALRNRIERIERRLDLID